MPPCEGRYGGRQCRGSRRPTADVHAQYAPEPVGNIADSAVWIVYNVFRPKFFSQTVCFQRALRVCDDKREEIQAKIRRNVFFRKRSLRVPDFQIPKAVHIDIAVAVFRRPLCRGNGLAQLDLVQLHNNRIGDDEQECRIVLKARRVVYRDIPLIDALGANMDCTSYR